MLFRLAFIANGDMNSLSNDNERAISAIVFAVICNLTGSFSPSIWRGKIKKEFLDLFRKMVMVMVKLVTSF